MRRAVPLLLLALCACGTGRGGRLQGHWRGVRTEGVPSDLQPAATAFAVQMELDIRGDTVRVTTPKETRTSRFSVTKDEGRSVVITTDTDGPNDPQTFTVVDEKTILWAALPGKSIVFSRQ